jgi:hypothetical protein
MLPRQVQLVLQHSYRVSDGLDFKDETLHRQISAKLDVRSGLAVLQSGLGKLKSNRNLKAQSLELRGNYFVFLRMRDLYKNPSESSNLRFLALWIESRIRIVGYESNLFGVRICGHDTVRIHGFAKWIHVFMNLLYDSCILMFLTFLTWLLDERFFIKMQ